MEVFGGFSASQHSAEHPVLPLYNLGLLVPIFFFVVAAGSSAATAAFLSYSNMCDVFFLCDHLWQGFFPSSSSTLFLPRLRTAIITGPQSEDASAVADKGWQIVSNDESTSAGASQSCLFQQ